MPIDPTLLADTPVDRWYCDCSGADAATCANLHDRPIDGPCDCPCHAEYEDDPEHWQRLCLSPHFTAAESAASDDLIDRIDAAEALTKEVQPCITFFAPSAAAE